MLVAFVCFVFISRDWYAAIDGPNYIEYFATGVDSVGAEPAFSLLVSLFLSINLNEFLIYGALSSLYFLSFYFLSLSSRSFLPLFFAFCSEGFVYMSFNGLRQGVAIAFFIVAITLFFSTYFTSGLRALFSTLFYILSLLSHTSAVALLPICLLGLFFVQRKIVFERLSYVFLNLRLPKLYICIFLFLLVISPLVLLLPYTSSLYDFVLLYINRSELHGFGFYGGVYRIFVGCLIGFYITRFSSSKSNSPQKIKFLQCLNCGTLLLLPLAPFFPQVFVRLSYYAVVPASFALSFKMSPKSNLLFSFLVVFVSFITYSNAGVLKNLGLSL